MFVSAGIHHEGVCVSVCVWVCVCERERPRIECALLCIMHSVWDTARVKYRHEDKKTRRRILSSWWVEMVRTTAEEIFLWLATARAWEWKKREETYWNGEESQWQANPRNTYIPHQAHAHTYSMNTDRYPESVHLHSPTYSTCKYTNVNAWPLHLSHCRHITSALYVTVAINKPQLERVIVFQVSVLLNQVHFSQFLSIQK